jgi:DNA-binding MarR family transcriptional regulator
MRIAAPRRLDPEQYGALAAFRHELRRFLSFSEAAAVAAGLPPQQHQALLAIAGHRGADLPTVGAVAEQLIIAPQTAAELVARMVEAGLLTKAASTVDRRRQELTLTAKAQALLAALTEAHLDELSNLDAALGRALAASRRSPA